MKSFKKIVLSFFVIISVFVVMPTSIAANENDVVVRRLPTRQFSKDYSYEGAKGRLDIVYTINPTTGKISDLSAKVVVLTPGEIVYLNDIEFSGNKVTVSIGFDGASVFDVFYLY